MVGEDGLVFIRHVMLLVLGAYTVHLVPGRLAPKTHNGCAFPVLSFSSSLGQGAAALQLRNCQFHSHLLIPCGDHQLVGTPSFGLGNALEAAVRTTKVLLSHGRL